MDSPRNLRSATAPNFDSSNLQFSQPSETSIPRCNGLRGVMPRRLNSAIRELNRDFNVVRTEQQRKRTIFPKWNRNYQKLCLSWLSCLLLGLLAFFNPFQRLVGLHDLWSKAGAHCYFAGVLCLWPYFSLLRRHGMQSHCHVQIFWLAVPVLGITAGEAMIKSSAGK